MQRLNIGYIYWLNKYIHPLTNWSAKVSIFDLITQSSEAQDRLNQMFKGNFYGLRSSCPSANYLIELLDNIRNEYFAKEPPYAFCKTA